PNQLWAAQHQAPAATITVNTTDDELNSDGDCSLREAVQAANTNTAVDACPAGNGADTISIPAGTYTIQLAGFNNEDANANGDLDILESLTMIGAGKGSTIIDGNTFNRALHVNPAGAADFSFHAEDMTLTNGFANSGAGIFLSQSSARLKDVQIRSNAANAIGGGIFASNSVLVIEENSEIANNTAIDGAGLFVDLTGQVQIENSVIRNNIASGDGGAAYLIASSVIRNTTIENNQATRYGGAIYSEEDLLVEDSLIRHNAVTTTTGQGGGFHLFGSLVLENSTVFSNTAPLGGGIYVDSRDGLHVSQSILRQNKATTDGGGIYYAMNGGVIVEDSLFDNNRADNDGGAILVDDESALSIDRSTFTNNTAGADGGAIMSGVTDFVFTSVRNSTLTQNRAGRHGGAVYSHQYGVAFENSTVVANTAVGNGGGYHADSYYGYFYNTILAGNSANGSSSDASADCYAVSNRLHSAGRNLFGQSTGCQPSRYDQTLSVGNLFTTVLDPLADNGGALLPDNTRPQSYALKSGSPAIDAGSDDFCPTNDQTGSPRFNGNACDIGAVESSISAPLSAAFENIITVDTAADDNTVDGRCSLREAVRAAETNAAVDSCAAGSDWDVIQLNAGTHIVISPSITITNEHVTIRGVSAAQTIIDGNNDSRIFEVRDSGGLILHHAILTNGVTSGDGGCLYGFNGFAVLVDTVVSGCTADSGGGIFMYGHLNTVRSRIENNSSRLEGGGIYTDNSHLFMRDSSLTSNTTQRFGGGLYTYVGLNRMNNLTLISNTVTLTSSFFYGGGGVDMDYGVMIIENRSDIAFNQSANDCGGLRSASTATLIDLSNIRHNRADQYGGGVCNDSSDIWIRNSLIEHNVAGINGGGFYGSGRIKNSTIRYNQAGYGGGGLATAFFEKGNIIENSSIYGNRAGHGGGIIAYVPVHLDQVTLSENSAITRTGGIFLAPSSQMILRNSIIANSTGSDCSSSGVLFDGGYNLIESGECITASTSVGGDPLLEPMAGLGADDFVLKLRPTSPAIDLVPLNANGCGTRFTTDQRGFVRPF
ncbi:MAG: choice-of-anchor Q domain-containing protein, partial [Chloroflexota bacterium]